VSREARQATSELCLGHRLRIGHDSHAFIYFDPQKTALELELKIPYDIAFEKKKKIKKYTQCTNMGEFGEVTQRRSSRRRIHAFVLPQSNEIKDLG
jgi:hypothetical protein